MTMTRDRIRRYESHGYRHGHHIRSLPAQFYLFMQDAFSAPRTMLFELKLALHFLLVLMHIVIAPFANGASKPN